MHVGPVGVLALPPNVTRPMLEAMLADAREFVADWLEMRPVFQHRLFGQCLRAPLQVRPADIRRVCTDAVATIDVCSAAEAGEMR